VTFVVLGNAATKGSTVSFMGTRGIVTKTDSTTLAPWTKAVAWTAKAAHVRLAPRERAIHVAAVFQVTRPKNTTRRCPIVRPDIDKTTRALLDALTGVAYVDDAQVVRLDVEKVYGPDARTTVRIEEVG
jgi:Holliday junction resolvase RusA-like endonuclease